MWRHNIEILLHLSKQMWRDKIRCLCVNVINIDDQRKN